MAKSCVLKGQEVAEARRRAKENKGGPDLPPTTWGKLVSASMMLTGFLLQTDFASPNMRVAGIGLALSGIILISIIIYIEGKSDREKGI